MFKELQNKPQIYDVCTTYMFIVATNKRRPFIQHNVHYRIILPHRLHAISRAICEQSMRLLNTAARNITTDTLQTTIHHSFVYGRIT